MGTSHIDHGRGWRMTLIALTLLCCAGSVSGCCTWWAEPCQSTRAQRSPGPFPTASAGLTKRTLEPRQPAAIPSPTAPAAPKAQEAPPGTPRVSEPRLILPKPSKPLSRRQKKRLQALGVLFFRDAPSHETPPVTVQGWLYGPPGDQRFRLRLTNRTSSLIQMSYIADRYIIETREGRVVALAKEEFLNYPSALFPGDEHDVILRLPADLGASTISRLTITLNTGHPVITLTPLGAPAAAEARSAAPPATRTR